MTYDTIILCDKMQMDGIRVCGIIKCCCARVVLQCI